MEGPVTARCDTIFGVFDYVHTRGVDCVYWQINWNLRVI